MTDPKQKFSKLIDAIQLNDWATIESLRTDWEEIRQYVQSAEPEDDLGEKQPALILWLTTPPAGQPVDWHQVTGVPDFVIDERKQQIQLVNTLWESWLSGEIVGDLHKRVSASRKFPVNWFTNAQNWLPAFAERMPIKRSSTDVEQTRLDVVAGYGAFVDHLLIQQGASAKTAVIVDGTRHPPVLALEDNSVVSMDSVAESIHFRSGLLVDDSRDLAIAISYSLPAHAEILPGIYVEVGDRCELSSTWQDPLAHRKTNGGSRG